MAKPLKAIKAKTAAIMLASGLWCKNHPQVKEKASDN